MKENGATFPKIDIISYGLDDRGIEATADIKKNEIVLFVPYDLLVTSKSFFGDIEESELSDDYKFLIDKLNFPTISFILFFFL